MQNNNIYIYNLKVNLSNLQNKQKKDDLNFINQINKRFMFGISNVRNLKKSGEIINTSIKSESQFISPLNSPRIGLNSLIMPTININTTYINKFAQYNKLNINNLFYRETLDCKYYKFKLKDRLNYNLAYCKNKLILGEINDNFMLNYSICSKSIQYGMQLHTAVTEIIDQTDESITFSYYIITTSKNIVNYGGGNVFKPIFLCSDLNSGKNFYTIPLLCIDRVPKTDFMNIYKIKRKEDFKDDYDLQKKLVDNIIKMEKTEGIKFKQFHIRDDFLEKDITDINFSNIFKDKDVRKLTTPWVDSILDN